MFSYYVLRCVYTELPLISHISTFIYLLIDIPAAFLYFYWNLESNVP